MQLRSEVFQGNTIETKLTALGLPSEVLINAIAQGQASRNNATANHPANAGGTMAFFEVVRALRDNLLPLGWKKENIRNLSMTVNPETKIAVVVSGGSKDTGLKDGYPTTRNPKGEQTKSYLVGNQRDLFLDFDYVDDFSNSQPIDGIGQTWLLLYYCDLGRKEVRAELSLPTSFDSFCRVGAWKERILLDPIPLDNHTIEIEPDFNPEIDIDIKRKV
jgi:hypothetical protein